MLDLQYKKVLVTGNTSMIGMAVCQALVKRNAIVLPCYHKETDLLSFTETQKLFNTLKPDYVIHCAGWNGGIVYNKKYPADIFYRTTEMALNVLTCCNDFGIQKTLSIISSCALPDKGQEVLKAEDIWDGAPNPTVECHGLSKRILHAYSRQLNKQWGLKANCAVLTNSYGPFDSFHLEKTKVAGALIRKVVEAKQFGLPSITCFGTGMPKRELMFSLDAGEALVQTLEKYDEYEYPLNIGTGTDVTIKELVETIADIVNYKGEIVWDTTKADGQMRKLLDSEKMRGLLNVPITPMRDALLQTIQWYINNKAEADGKN